jgi:hypothetical protein
LRRDRTYPEIKKAARRAANAMLGESSRFGLAHTTVPALCSQEDIASYQVGHRAALFLRRKTGPNCSPPAPGRPRDAFRTQTWCFLCIRSICLFRRLNET